MPVRLLTDAERGRLSSFPREVPTEDLHAFFTESNKKLGHLTSEAFCPAPTSAGKWSSELDGGCGIE